MGMIEVIGPWGSGTSLVCAILEANGCWFGRSIQPAGGATGRNKHGLYEYEPLFNADGDEERTAAAMAGLMLEAEEHELRPACKLPSIITTPQLWPIWFAAADAVVWVERDKDYTKDKVWQSITTMPLDELERIVLSNLALMREQHPCTTQYTVRFDELLRQPARVITELVCALGLPPTNTASFDLVDTSWPTSPPCDRAVLTSLAPA